MSLNGCDQEWLTEPKPPKEIEENPWVDNDMDDERYRKEQEI